MFSSYTVLYYMFSTAIVGRMLLERCAFHTFPIVKNELCPYHIRNVLRIKMRESELWDVSRVTKPTSTYACVQSLKFVIYQQNPLYKAASMFNSCEYSDVNIKKYCALLFKI